MKNVKKIMSNNYLLAFLIPIVISAVIYFFLGMYPFGDNSILVTDLNNQYVSYLEYFKNSILGNDSLFYSFSKTMGGSMIDLNAYYTLSPFNLLLLFSNTSNLPMFILIITMLKVATSGLTMNIFLNYIHPENKNYSIIFSTIYALSAYMLVYQQNIMWMDGVILLPIVILGITELIYGKRWYIYPIFLTLTLITNYYIGFMICIFSVLYFILSLVKFNLDTKKFNLKPVLAFTLTSLLAGLLSSFILIPTLFALQGGKSEFDLSVIFDFSRQFGVIDFLSKFVIGSFSGNEIQSGLPNIYSTLLVSFLGLHFLINRNINISTKIKYGVLLVLIFLSFQFNGLDLVWHALNEPTWFPYRYSFIFSFLIIIMAYKSIINFSTNKLVNSSLIFLIIFSFLIIYNRGYEYITTNAIIFSIIFLFIWLLFTTYKRANSKLIMVFIIFELIVNGYNTLGKNGYADYHNYSDFVETNQPVVDQYSSYPDSFGRLEMKHRYNENTPLTLNYAGLSHYSSSEKSYIKEFLGNMGFRNKGNSAIYSTGSTSVAESILGVQYVLNKSTEISKYPVIDTQNTIKVEENRNAFPFGYSIQSSDNLNNGIDADNTFEYQNQLFEAITGIPQIMTPVEDSHISVELNNLETETDDSGNTVYNKTSGNGESSIAITFSNIDSSYINLYLDSSSKQGVDIYINDEYYGEDLTTYTHNAVSFPNNEDTHTVKIIPHSDNIELNDVHMYQHNIDDLRRGTEVVRNNQMNVSSFSPSEISGSIEQSNERENMVFSIPYNEDWKITTGEGEELNTFGFKDILLGVEVPPETDNLTLKYIPKGLYPSIAISGVGWGGMLTYWIVKRSKKKNNGEG